MCATASSAATSACSTCAPESCGARPNGFRRPGERVRVSSTRLVSFAQRAVAAILYEVEPLDEPTTVVVQSELVTNETLPARRQGPTRRRRAFSPLQSEFFERTARRAILVHSTEASGLTDRCRDGPRDRRTPGTIAASRVRGPGRLTVTADVRARQATAPRQVPRLRLVGERSVPASATRSRRRSRRRATPAGTGCSPSSAPTSTTSGSAPTSRSKATPSYSRRCASRCFTSSRRARAPSGARSRPKASPALGYDGHAFWDTETFVLPVLTYTTPHAAARRAALAPRPLNWRGHAPDARPDGRRIPVAHDPRRGVLGLLARRHRRVSRQRRHRRRGRSLPGTPPTITRSNATPGSSCWSRRRGCGARSATTTPPDGSASTASPDPTNTARSPTTTCTRT